MARLDVRAMTLLSFAHVVDDYNQSFIPALLPFLIIQRHLTHETAAGLVFAQAISSSVVQPAIGVLADRRSMPWLIALGIFLAGCGVAAIGWLSPLWVLYLAALVSGIGVAAFHPEAARFANYVAGDRKASGMRWFTVGGNLGFAVGPTFATAAVAAWGLRGTAAAFVPVTLVAVIVLFELRRLRTFVPTQAKRRAAEGVDNWPAFGKLSAFVIIRSMTYLGLVSFIPLYVVEELRVRPAVGDAALTAFLFAGVVGTIAGGPLADRFGRKPILLWSTGATTVVAFALIALTHGGGLAAAIPLLILLGLVLYASQAPMVVLGQEYLPTRMGLASGVTLGLAVSLGGMFTPVLGWIADAHGITASIVTLAVLAALSLVIGFTLPSERRRRPALGEAVA
ncbi:MAG TPA: MFS transporter [Candidatus Limnocylindria bacterium]|jgi:FSR family fosmidomycin resistance protein-like MFS transporter|nr:MFS transporter [Candidatus Limnocylindria bacterium]